MVSVQARIAEELGVKEQQVQAAVELLDGGATVPFIARYRKEATGSLDDAQLRTLEERLRLSARAGGRAARRSSTPSASRESSTPTLEAAIMRGRQPRRGSRTSTSPTSPSAARRPRSPGRRGWSRSPTLLLGDPHAVTRRQRGAYVIGRQERRRRGGGARRRARHPGRALRRGRRPDRRAARGLLGATGASSPRCARARRPGRQVQPTISTSRSPRQDAVAPGAGAVPRREGGDPGPDASSRTIPRRADGAQAVRSAYELRIARGFGIADQGRPGDKWLRRDRALGVAHEDPHHAVDRPPAAPVDGGRGRGGAGVRRQPARPAARRPGRRAADAGARSRLPHRREGRGGRRHRQGGGHRARSTRTSRSAAGTRRSPSLARLVREHQVELIAIGNGTASRETDKLATELMKRLPELQAARRSWCRRPARRSIRPRPMRRRSCPAST